MLSFSPFTDPDSQQSLDQDLSRIRQEKRFGIVVAGPTGSGKSVLAEKLAEEWQIPLINFDSVQLYKYFDVGSNKPPPEKRVLYRLLDCLEPTESMDAGHFRKLFREQVPPQGGFVAVGGTGLYLRAALAQEFHDLPTDPGVRQKWEQKSTAEIKAFLEEYDPIRLEKIQDRTRMIRACEIYELTGRPFAENIKHEMTGSDAVPVLSLYLKPEREHLVAQLRERTQAMMRRGIINEVQELWQKYGDLYPNLSPAKSIGYAQVLEFLDGKISSQEALEEAIFIRTRQYAKRQVTWFNQYLPAAKILSSAARVSKRIGK